MPKLTLNELFVRDLISADTPCFALGLVEERKETSGFLALRPSHNIPANISSLGFKLGHSLIGTSQYEAVQFVFEFYGFATYSVILNPNNPIVRQVLSKMIDTQDYFIFAINPDQRANTFRSNIGGDDLIGLKANLPRIFASGTTNEQYEDLVEKYVKKPLIKSHVLNWVCRDNKEYLDINKYPFEISPAV